MKFFSTTVSIPTEQRVALEAAELWAVRWPSHSSRFSRPDLLEYKDQMAAFTTKEDAEKFKQALFDAWKLAKIRGLESFVRIEKMT